MAVKTDISKKVDKFCNLGDMLDADGGCDSALSSNNQNQICLEKPLWIPTHSNWKRVLVKTESEMTYTVSSGTLNTSIPYHTIPGKVYATCVRSCLMHGSETWPMKVEHVLKWVWSDGVCGVKLNERKKNEKLRELLGLEPVSLMIKKSRLRWFGHVEQKDNNDWVKRCITWEVEGIRQRGRPKKT